MRRLFIAALAVSAVVLAAVGAAPAQTFPSKPITVVIPLAAGGAVDTNVRIMVESMRTTLPQSDCRPRSRCTAEQRDEFATPHSTLPADLTDL